METLLRTASRKSPRLAGFERAFQKESRELLVERARFLLKICLVVYPAFWSLDLIVAPELAGRFLQIRVAVCLLYLLSLAAVYSPRAASLVQPVVVASTLVSAAGIAIMSSQIGGFTSNYFAGNMIVLFVIGVFLPWELRTVALLSGLIIATDLGIHLAVHSPSRDMAAPLIFLVGSCVFTWLATLSSRRTRRRDLSLRLRLEEANARIEEASLTDELTQLRNRRFLEQALASDLDLVARRHEDGKAAAGEADLLFLLIDLDHFKSVNDSYGHTVGDAVLVEVASLLRSKVRTSDHLVRWGGEEILLVARFIDRRDGPALAEKVRAAIEAHEIRLDNGTLLRQTGSIGFVAYPFSTRKPRAFSWQQTVGIADLGLYAAKRSGRNAWVGLDAGDLEEPEEALRRLKENPELFMADGEIRVYASSASLGLRRA